jgi:hypothetical protein
MAKCFAGEFIGEVAVIEGGDAVNEDVLHADGVPGWVGVVGRGTEFRGVKDGDIGEVVFANESAVIESEALGGETGAFVDAEFP